MPELPEVEVVRRGMLDHLVGRTITALHVHDVRSLRRHVQGVDDFVTRLTGQLVLGVERRGKYLWLELANGASAVVHLGMSGQILIDPPVEPKHTKIVFDLDDGHRIVFVDQRIFGGLFLDEQNPPAAIDHIALDPLDPDFDIELFVRRMRAKKVAVKRCLLDQSLISGIGNIYADEALWRARVHYARPAAGLSAAKARELVEAARDVMAEALEQGGTSFDALYVNVQGESGYFARSLNVYGREGEPCPRCGGPIRRERFDGRSSHFCPRCQRKQ